MVKSETQFFKFGTFEIDTVKRVLLHENAPVQLPSRAFDVLLALVEHNHYVVDKDELMRLVWGERVVEENNLTRHISTLRKALDESPNDHRYIVTVPGRGYSFVADIQRVQTNGERLSAPKRNGNDAAPGTDSRNGLSDNTVELITQLDAGQARDIERTRLKGRWLWASALVLVIAASVLLGLSLLRTRSKLTEMNSYRTWDVIRLTRSGGSVLPDISRDGRYVAYVNKESGQESVWILQLATSTRQQIVPAEKFVYFDLLFTLDGSEVYFTRREGSAPQPALYRIPVLGGVVKKLRVDIDSRIILSPDGAHLAFARRNNADKPEVIIADADGVEERVVFGGRLDFPAWSPDGKVIAFSTGNADSGGENMSLNEIRLDDGMKREISLKKWNYLSHKAWLPDGSGLIVCAREQKSNASQLWFVAYPSGDAHPLSSELDSFSVPRLTGDGRTLVTQQTAAVSDIWSGPLANISSAKKVGVWGKSGVGFIGNWAIVYSSLQAGESTKIWVMNIDGTEPKQVTAENGNDTSAVASPDGRHIVFASDRSGNLEIWRMKVDGSNLLQLTSGKGATSPSITPDGKWVIYLSPADGYLYKVPINGGDSARVAGQAVGVSAVSPDGNLIGYFTWVKNRWGIAVSSFEDGSLVKTFDLSSQSLNNRALKWAPDGKSLLYAASSDGVGNIWLLPVETGPPRQITNFKADGIFHFDISPDGKDLICARGAWKHDIVLIKNVK
jgi:Tol biopolymer transport system component/DNA-binding winged helix-turn-helix (wHTH) protein